MLKSYSRYLSELLKPHRRMIVLCSGLAVMAAGLDTLGPVLMGRSFDLAKRPGPAVFLVAIGAWFVLHAVSDWLRQIISYEGGRIGYSVRVQFMLRTLPGLLAKPLAFHDGKSAQDTREKVGQMQWKIEQAISNTLFDFLPGLLATAVILTYLWLQDWRIGLALTVSVVAYLIVTWKSVPESTRVADEWSEASRKMNVEGWNALSNTLIVKSTSNEGAVRGQMEAGADEFNRKDVEYNRFQLRLGVLQTFIINAGSLAILAIALANFRSGAFTLGQVTALTAFAFQIFGYVRSSQWQMRVLIEGSTIHGELEKLLKEPDEDMASGRAVALAGGVEFRHVRFGYRADKKPALEDVSFRVKPGEKVAIVGESGQGKTTITHLLGRYYEPQSGEILFDGVDSREVSRDSLRSQMALVPQDLTLFHKTLEYNIRYGRPDATDAELAEAIRQASLDEFIERLPEKLKTLVGERGLKLSGGERQRVALARAFLRQPKILILDEPTSNLDSKTENAVQNSLERLMQNRTTFIIAHRLRTIRSADTILVLKDGRIAEHGTHDELLAKNGVYAELLRAQSAKIEDARPEDK